MDNETVGYRCYLGPVMKLELKEWKWLKTFSLTDESISFYDLLIDDQVSRYLSNEQIAW